MLSALDRYLVTDAELQRIGNCLSNNYLIIDCGRSALYHRKGIRLHYKLTVDVFSVQRDVLVITVFFLLYRRILLNKLLIFLYVLSRSIGLKLYADVIKGRTHSLNCLTAAYHCSHYIYCYCKEGKYHRYDKDTQIPLHRRAEAPVGDRCAECSSRYLSVQTAAEVDLVLSAGNGSDG